MELKIYFLEVFRDAFAERVVESVLRFFCAQPVFCKDFHQIDVFEKARKKRIWDPFWEAKATKL